MNRLLSLVFAVLIGASPLAQARTDVSVGIALPGISIGINQPAYPRLVRVPGYPVYYYPNARYNYFFYDGLFWVFIADQWYASSWYDGPWSVVEPYHVPVYLLRVPVRYYAVRPVYFRYWRVEEPPRWGEHWGRDWERRRDDWRHWDGRRMPRPAPLPSYQQRYAGQRYPNELERQRSIRDSHYGYRPREDVSWRTLERASEPRHQAPRRDAYTAPRGNDDHGTPRREDDPSRQRSWQAPERDAYRGREERGEPAPVTRDDGGRGRQDAWGERQQRDAGRQRQREDAYREAERRAAQYPRAEREDRVDRGQAMERPQGMEREQRMERTDRAQPPHREQSQRSEQMRAPPEASRQQAGGERPQRGWGGDGRGAQSGDGGGRGHRRQPRDDNGDAAQ